MRTTNDIAAEIEEIIPSHLYERYRHLSYADMAEVPELSDWAEALRTAEREWNKLEGQ
jgi:hypothetical protein